MFLLSDDALFCPPESLFSRKDEANFSPAKAEGQPFIAFWGEAKSVINKSYKVICCGRPVFSSLSSKDLSWHPCHLLAQRIADQLTTSSPKEALNKQAAIRQGSFTIIIWDTQSNHRFVYTKGQRCFTDSKTLSSVTPHPYTLSQKKLFILPEGRVCSSQELTPLTPSTQTFMPLDPLQYFERIIFTHPKALEHTPQHLTFFAENIGLCAARMMKDILETRHNIQTNIFPLGTTIQTSLATKNHPFILLPSVFSPYAHTVEAVQEAENVHILQPAIFSDTFPAPLLYPLHQWASVLFFLGENAPLSVDGRLVAPLIEQFAPFIPQLKASYRIYLGRSVFAGFARVCAYYDHAITKTFSSHYPSGELKHGPLALVDENVTALIFCPDDHSFQKNLNNIKEVRARKGHVLALTNASGAQALKKENIPSIVLDTQGDHDFVALAWMCMHRLMFLLDV